MAEAKQDVLARAARVRDVFTPSAPVRTRDLFAGRTEQMRRLLYAVQNAGQHAVIYGEPGVGKTSLGKTMLTFLESAPATCLYVTCDSRDDFATVWKRAISKVGVRSPVTPVGFRGSGARSRAEPLEEIIDGLSFTPHTVADVLATLTVDTPLVLFIDEFDRTPQASRAPFAELVKSLSDRHVDATVVFIGVADDVEQLIAEHRSIERNLEQIQMPRMSTDELADLVLRGLRTAGMTIDDRALQRITVLSRGLPHFTHLAAKLSAVNAAEAERYNVAFADVEVGVENAVKHSQQSLVSAYGAAASSARSNRYRDVLLACALSPCDEQGYVTASSVRQQLEVLSLDAGSVTRYLAELSTESRGRVLRQVGPQRRHRYRFTNPLMQPYVVMRGLVRGVAVEDVA